MSINREKFMNQVSLRRSVVAIAAIIAILVCTVPSQAGWRRCCRGCREVCGEPHRMQAEPRVQACVCRLFPICDLGGGYYVFYSEQHDQCGSSAVCNAPSVVYYADVASLPVPEDCATPGGCKGSWSVAAAPPIALPSAKPANWNGSDLAPGMTPTFYGSPKDVQFFARNRMIHARVFLMEVSPGHGMPSRSVAFGCEIQDPGGVQITIGKPAVLPFQDHLFECKYGSVTYVVITAD